MTNDNAKRGQWDFYGNENEIYGDMGHFIYCDVLPIELINNKIN